MLLIDDRHYRIADEITVKENGIVVQIFVQKGIEKLEEERENCDDEIDQERGIDELQTEEREVPLRRVILHS